MTKEINGYLWPDTDQECARAIFDQLPEALENVYSRVHNYRTAVQAGGNVGLWAVELAKRFERVCTWEPHPQNFHCLRNNLRRHHARNVYAFNAALAEEPFEDKRAVLTGDDRNCGAYQVERTDLLTAGVPFMTVDQLELENVDLIYFDIEGYEYHALRGALHTIRTFHPLIILEQKGLGADEEKIEPMMAELGYTCVHSFARDKVYQWNVVKAEAAPASPSSSSSGERKASTGTGKQRGRLFGRTKKK